MAKKVAKKAVKKVAKKAPAKKAGKKAAVKKTAVKKGAVKKAVKKAPPRKHRQRKRREEGPRQESRQEEAGQGADAHYSQAAGRFAVERSLATGTQARVSRKQVGPRPFCFWANPSLTVGAPIRARAAASAPRSSSCAQSGTPVPLPVRSSIGGLLRFRTRAPGRLRWDLESRPGTPSHFLR